MNSNPIAVFDSGLGGLSVVRHLRQLLPGEHIVYFGDTARVPYGSKSRQTVVTFALESARFLMQFEPKLVVAACNTASALALDALRDQLPVPVVDVVAPGARAAGEHAAHGAIGIIGTEATIGSGAYPAALRAIAPGVEVVSKACPLFVALVEEGRNQHEPIVSAVIADYLGEIRARGIRALVLGCTHYPLLRDAIAAFLGPAVYIVDSGRETSLAVRAALEAGGDLCPTAQAGSLTCYVSDNPARFKRVGSRFLGHELETVEFVEPERYISSEVG